MRFENLNRLWKLGQENVKKKYRKSGEPLANRLAISEWYINYTALFIRRNH